MLTDVGWCRDCHDFAMLERLPTVEGLEREAEEWFFAKYPEERTTRMQPMMEEALRAQQRDRVEQYRPLLDYLERRTSPPRCLTCGGTVFIRYAEWNTWYDHPLQVGQFEVVCIGHADVTSSPLLYDPDGTRLKC